MSSRQIVKRRTLHGIFGGIVALAMVQTAWTQENRFTFAAEGVPRSVLVIPDSPDPDETLAAREIGAYLEKISGATLKIVEASRRESDLPAIRIGLSLSPSDEKVLREQSADPASFRIRVTPKEVVVAGLSPEGTLFGAYELLERLGVRWYMPGDLGEVVPRTRNVTLPVGSFIRTPSFPARHLQTANRATPWYRRQKLGGLYFPGAHGIPARIGKDEQHLRALVHGKRRGPQLCISHPEVVKRATAAAISFFDKDPHAEMIGMGPADGSGFCECENCRALDSGEWDPYSGEPSMTDRYIWFFNQVLEGLHKKHPGKKIAFYAYHTYKLPPKKWQPDPHIVPAFAPITLCRIHGMNNPICPDRSFYRHLMTAWGDLLPEVYERGYFFNLACPDLPFSKVHAVRDEIPFAYKAGVKGWRVETFAAWATHTPTLYVASRLMWDVETDVDALLAEFYEKFFGPAAKPMGEYFTRLDHAFRDTDCHTGGSFCMPRVFTKDRMQKSRELLNSAARRAGKETVYAQRIALFRKNFERLESFLAMLEARNGFDFKKANDALETLKKQTTELVDFRLYPNPVGPAPEGNKNDRQARALWWRSAHAYIRRFWSPCTEQGYDRTVVRGDLAAGCPEPWDFLIDPTDVGESLSWYRDDVVGGNWQPMKTVTASWSDQGLHYYKGIAWYRTEVTVPERFAGRTVYLWFGGVDEKATVWLNGECLGTTQKPNAGLPGVSGAFRPVEFDVTTAVRFDAPNRIAVKIENKALNEIGTGGLVAPVMFWSPKAEK